MKCSLIISTYNWPGALEVCLLSVLAQKHLPDEVIIADDGSAGETRQLIARYAEKFPVPVHHVWHEDMGFRKTIVLNKGVHKSKYDYIVQVDGDVILDKHFIADHLASAEPGAFVRGTRAMLTPERTKEVLDNKDINISWLSTGIKHRNNALRLFALRALGARKKMSSNSVRGSNLAFWKADFIRINGYDNDLQGWGHEDEELAARFINAGIIKKIIKLCAVQYHLYHKVSNKDNEPGQRQTVERVKEQNIQQTKNGYGQVSN
ncbi:glycosyltransferase family 2 protein [Mucilaginibacter sp.]|jgi:glycosyltransferase involved in cell wall biosynthesis|uniref:glycosyltransferase family 2 protein n=1 Tax=Mucilaginibacter sp. TaxID=1882438 RepID=UPI0035648915